MAVDFLHTADWQLGKPFAGIADPQKRGLVQQERLAVLDRIAAAARESRCRFIVVAGDLFDSPGVTKTTVAQACSAIGRMEVPVFAIPGNHDHGGPGSVWEQEFFRRECAALSPNFTLLRKAEPVVLEEAVLFPCPLLRRAEPVDPTAWLRDPALTEALPSDKLRIVLAHGSVQGFGPAPTDADDGESGGNRIALDRLPSGVFDYIALGDWHGFKEVTGSAWYSGTPEPDRFPKGDGNRPGHVLHVTAQRGGSPEVRPVNTARLRWQEMDWHFSEDSSLPALSAGIQDWLGQRAGQDLLRLRLSGSLGIGAAAELRQAIESWDARLLRLKMEDRTLLAPSPGELEDLTRRPGDPLISRVAGHLVRQLSGPPEEAEPARLALRELHALMASS